MTSSLKQSDYQAALDDYNKWLEANGDSNEWPLSTPDFIMNHEHLIHVIHAALQICAGSTAHVMVPLEPTAEMVAAVYERRFCEVQTNGDVGCPPDEEYKAMIAAHRNPGEKTLKLAIDKAFKLAIKDWQQPNE